MFIGREKELNRLEELYRSKRFEFLVMYGRRRIGKTALLKEFSKQHSCLFFSAEESDNNLSRFSAMVLRYFGEPDDMTFPSWESCFFYIASHSNDNRKTIIIMDEFPYIVHAENEVKSVLQNAIDHLFSEKNILLILCGSSVSFMINDVMGRKTPLYGRNTAVMEILPFTYDRVKEFLPHYSKEDQMKVYSILGGVPYYLSRFRDDVSLERNVADQILSPSAPLQEEPWTLLKSELREIYVYNDILKALAGGANRLQEIADKAKVPVNHIPVYLETLKEMRVVEKTTCCGEKETSRKTQYRICDPLFAFWYRFVFSHRLEIDLYDDPIEYFESMKEVFSVYMGFAFETICLQYLKKEARNGNLPFRPQSLGKWWGSNPITKTSDDIDILGIKDDKYLFCECKFRNELFGSAELKNLIGISDIFAEAKEKYFIFFAKRGFSKEMIGESRNYFCRLVTIDEMI